MSLLVAEFVRRHRQHRVNRTKALILGNIALVADDKGRGKMTQPMLAFDIGCTERTIRREIKPMLRPAPGGEQYLAKGPGRTYIIVGYLEHDPGTCDSVECRAEVEIGWVTDRKRAQAAARARRAREKRKREAASSGR